MATTDPALWHEHTVGKPGGDSDDCTPLTTISHVTHVGNALRIAEMSQITPGLVYDESTLNTTRTTVVWLSPNQWHNVGGSRYGNIEFVFDWKDVIKGMNVYRIEVQPYSPLAFRILLANEDLSMLYPTYDPTRDPGPWRHDKATGQHYWNGKICLEIMTSSPLSMLDCKAIKFIRHHDKRCCELPRKCGESGTDGHEGGARFIGGVVGRSIRATYLPVTREEGKIIKPTKEFENGWEGVYLEIRDKAVKYTGTLTAADPAASAISRGILNAVSAKNEPDRLQLSGLFASRQEMVNACADLIEAHFEFTPGTLDRTTW